MPAARNYVRINLSGYGPVERAIIDHLSSAVPREQFDTPIQHRRSEALYLKAVLFELFRHGVVPEDVAAVREQMGMQASAPSAPAEAPKPSPRPQPRAKQAKPSPEPVTPLRTPEATAARRVDDDRQREPKEAAAAAPRTQPPAQTAPQSQVPAEKPAEDETPLEMLGPDDQMGGLVGGSNG